MKKLFTQLLLLFFVFVGNAQKNELDKLTGTYYLLDAERGVGNKPTKTKLVQFGENNGTELLTIAACEKCMPAVYTYQKKESDKYGIPVFLNSRGLYVLGYDSDSFIVVLVDKKLGNGAWSKFKFSNFYSKSKLKITKDMKKKVEDYAIKISSK